jgi:trk system potassium uptake protein TrkH
VNKYIVVLSIITLILGVTEKEPLLFLLFEAGSALCTVGFNTGVTAELTLFGKGLIIFLMLTGRAGILVLSFAEAIKKVALGELSGTIQSQSLIK